MKPKVKAIKSMTLSSLEEQINEFLDTFEYEVLRDIKIVDNDHYQYIVALIIYEE